MIRLVAFLLFVMFSVPAHAQDIEERTVPFTFSIFGPVSSNWTAYDRTTSYSCLGFINCAHLNIHGLAVAYFYNQTKQDLAGVGVGSIGNFVGGNSYGLELGFMANINRGSMYGLQLSVLNITGDRVYGAQAGLVNYSNETVGGLQFGILNMALGQGEEDTFAVQFGLFNVSNQERVIPIGLLNFVRGGRMSLELSLDSLGYNRLTLLSGSRYFYTVVDLDSRGLNAGKRDRYHHDSQFIRTLTYGLAVPINPNVNARLERIAYSPTWYNRDGVRGVRLVGEFAPSSYFSYHAGLEHIAFYESAQDRSPEFRSRPQKFFSLTAGLAVNALGFWK